MQIFCSMHKTKTLVDGALNLQSQQQWYGSDAIVRQQIYGIVLQSQTVLDMEWS